MKFSQQWLQEWIDSGLTTEQLVEQLTMAGLEVDSFGPVVADFSGIKVAEVLQCEKHPNADRLNYCTVHSGDAEELKVVCGAANVRAGLKVALACIGAKLGSLKIKKSKIRGLESQGMICSATELGLEASSEGILELAQDAPVGSDFKAYLQANGVQLDDAYIDIDITPNRGDCLSILGIAREVAALNQKPLNLPKTAAVPASSDTIFPIQLEAEQACPHYVGRVIENIDTQAKTPLWMSERLRRSGIRAIHPIVDVTNYVLLELGQPLHAFDLEKLDKRIVVRMASAHEKLVLLDNQQIALNNDVLVIADNSKPLAMAGIMGGQESSVTPKTQRIFLESAYFDPKAIAGRARLYGLHTDSAYRFERGVDPNLQVQALERATELILKICGGMPGPLNEASAPDYSPQLKSIDFNPAQIKRFLGIDIPLATVINLLEALHLRVQPLEQGLKVTVPSFRFDVAQEIDLIEEIARIYGYANIPEPALSVACSASELASSSLQVDELRIHAIRQRLSERGYHETVTYSFVDPKLQQLFDPKSEALPLQNPISADMAVMRTHLWPGLLSAIRYNQNRQQNRLRLFEMGLRFVLQNGQLKQQQVISGAIAGTQYPEQWGIQAQAVDFFDSKGDVQALLNLTRRAKAFMFIEAQHPALHPQQSTCIKIDSKTVGHVGAIHPALVQQLELAAPVYVFELLLDELMKQEVPQFAPLSKFPAIRRDMALIMDRTLTAQQIQMLIEKIAGDLLTDLLVFDVYQGEGIPADKKSMAVALTLQHQERTLTDAQINRITQEITASLQKTYGILLRS